MSEKFRELKDPCKTLIEEGRCLGCMRLCLPEFTGDENCKIAKENRKDWRI